MNEKRLGCISPLAIISALLTLLVLVVSGVISGSSMFSPGALNVQSGGTLGGVSLHAGIETNCAACHSAPWSNQSMADHCQVCHTTIQAEIADRSSIHGALLGHDRTISCTKCHREHQGPAAALTQFDPRGFDHEGIGYSLVGHGQREDGTPFACDDCHISGKTTFLREVCGDCHRQMDAKYIDDHNKQMGDDCLACHDGVDRFGQFDHYQTSYVLIGLHKQAACIDCHNSPRVTSDFANLSVECVSCHKKDDAHNAAFGPDCSLCHTAKVGRRRNSTITWQLSNLWGNTRKSPASSAMAAGIRGRQLNVLPVTKKTITIRAHSESSAERVTIRPAGKMQPSTIRCLPSHWTARMLG